MKNEKMIPARIREEYKVIKEYQEGGQSLTFLIEQNNQKYILKVPKDPNLSKEKKFRLEREIKALEMMEGNGVPKLHDFSIENETYIIMEYIPGPTLQEYIKGKPYDLIESVKIVLKLCETINNAHNFGLIHRDLKPDNIIINEATDEAIIIDFGICWLNDEFDFKTRKGQELGNRFLRLPELSKGTNVTISTSDITFLVGIFFFLLTNQHPNILLNEEGLQPQQRANVRKLPIWTNRYVDQIFEKGFTNEIANRFSTAQELKKELLKILNPMPEEEASKDGKNELDEIFQKKFFQQKEANIELIIKQHELFLDELNKHKHKELLIGGTNYNYSEKERSISTEMFLTKKNLNDFQVKFYLETFFDETFTRLIVKYGTEKIESEEHLTINELSKMNHLFPQLASLIIENLMKEFANKIRENLLK